jgi:hypothetical protein
VDSVALSTVAVVLIPFLFPSFGPGARVGGALDLVEAFAAREFVPLADAALFVIGFVRVEALVGSVDRFFAFVAAPPCSRRGQVAVNAVFLF